MTLLLRLAGLIDWFNMRIGKAIVWLVLLMTLISAGNAVVRKLFDTSSNAMLEIQWYLFSAIFLLGAAYTLQRDEHVRIDVVSGRFSARTRAWIDVFGALVFLMPMAVMILWSSWGVFVTSYTSSEMSWNAGGLILWPARLLVPVGFAMLIAQGLSELIKRVAFLAGAGPDPGHKSLEKTAEEELAEAIRASRQDLEARQ